ncbi:MAG: aminoacetone oxidase family FAD-binding enzyme [Patescibacteria group bacterium]
MSSQHYDVIVIGGGPSGMMAAGTAAERGKRVLLVEKNKNLGKKLSLTGGGRCNIFNAEEDTKKLAENYGDSAKFLYSTFSQYGMQDARDFFEKKGMPIVVEARKMAFPESQKATDVTKLMKKYVTSNHVELKTDTKVLGFKIENGKIVGIKTKDDIYTGDAFILATGGASYKETGSTGEGISWLKDLGYTVYKSNPNIVPLKVEEDWVKELSGTTLSFMKITFGADLPKNRGRFSKVGKILFTHFGVSGPLILNSSHEVKKLLEKGPVLATIDMYPDTEVKTLQNRVLEIFNKNKNKMLKNVVKEFAPNGMDEAFIAQFSSKMQDTKAHSIGREERIELVDRLKAMPLTITGTMGMDWAIISDGGVDLKEVDTKTMRSKLHNNLYFTGDVLHINRPSGGFSLQLCWTTGFVAGSSV